MSVQNVTSNNTKSNKIRNNKGEEQSKFILINTYFFDFYIVLNEKIVSEGDANINPGTSK